MREFMPGGRRERGIAWAGVQHDPLPGDARRLLRPRNSGVSMQFGH